MTTAVGAVTTAVDAALIAAWWQCSNAEVEAAVVVLERQHSRVEAARLRLLAEAKARGAGVASGAVSTVEWFATATGTRREWARERVALAEALNSDLATTGAALAAGDVTVDHTLVVHRTMGRIDKAVGPEIRAEAEAFLVAQASVLDPRQLAHAGRVLRHLGAPPACGGLDERAGEVLALEEDVAVVRREVRCTQSDDGTWLGAPPACGGLSGTLDAVGGATLAAALDPLSAPATALNGVPDGRSAARRRADALVQLADGYLAAQHGAESSRPRLVVSVPAATLTDPTAPGTAPGVLAGGAPVSASTVGMLACDAEVVPVLVSSDGTPLDVGRTVYAFPDRIRRAIQARDGGCTYPGCTRPTSWTQIHHLVAYSQGGNTSERNGTCLCPFHHRLVHRQGWRGELRGVQVTWHPPDRSHPTVPPPPWLPALDRLVQQWTPRAA